MSGRRLPLEAKVDSSFIGWTIRLPVRAEHIRLEKQPVVVEEVIIRRERRMDVVHVDETIQRERLRVETEGEVRPIHVPDAGTDVRA